MKQVTRSTRISVLRALISRTFGINVRKKRIQVREEGGRDIEVEEGDGARDIGWFIEGRTADVLIE